MANNLNTHFSNEDKCANKRKKRRRTSLVPGEAQIKTTVEHSRSHQTALLEWQTVAGVGEGGEKWVCIGWWECKVVQPWGKKVLEPLKSLHEVSRRPSHSSHACPSEVKTSPCKAPTHVLVTAEEQRQPTCPPRAPP